MALKIDMTGQIIGNFTVIKGKQIRHSDGQRWVWLCECVCGKQKWIRSHRLRGKRVVISCGCKRGRIVKCSDPLYTVWKNMHQRCRNPNNREFHSYGKRGIKICKRWYDFVNFHKDMGARPTLQHSLERINNNGSYEPANCRWATWKEQAFNRRTTKMSVARADEMRHLYAEGASKKQIARWYKVSDTTTYYVLAGITWANQHA